MTRTVVSEDGVRIACHVGGSGPALVMVHGAGSAAWTFGLLRPHLEERFTVVAVDRRGRGDSGDANGYEIAREVQDVLAVLGEFGPEAALFGHSYGGLVAAAAATQADGLAALALYEPPMGGSLASLEWTDRLETLIADGERDRAVAAFLRHVGGYSDAEVDAMRGTPVWEARLEIVPTVIRELRAEHVYRLPAEALAGLATPALLLVGTESPDWARRSTGAYAAAIGNPAVVPLQGQGHGAAASAPELVAGELLRFLA